MVVGGFRWFLGGCRSFLLLVTTRVKLLRRNLNLGLNRQQNISNNNSHVSIALTLNFDVKTLAFFKRS